MKIVLDTNVLVSALLSPHGFPAAVLRLIVSNLIEVCHDPRIICEYREVCGRTKFEIDHGHAKALIDYIEQTGIFVNAVPLPLTFADCDDAVFLEVAVSGKADFLVTGNLRHFPVTEYQGVKVIIPGDFIRVFRE